MIVDVDPKLIKPNPWQPRTRMDQAQLQELADSIKANGLLQPPIAREGERGRFELAFGHRRFEAWKMAKPGEPFPVELRELTDQQMAEHAATENGQREDLSPVERARGLRLLCSGPFNLTQAAAGKLYGLATQGAVSNAMRLLKLPDATLALIDEGKLPERAGRDLLPLMHFDPNQVDKLAARASKVPEEQRVDCVAEGIDDILRKLPSLDGYWHRERGGWPLDWPAEPINVPGFRKEKGEPAQVPACNGCAFAHVHNRSTYCLRPACHSLKSRLYQEHNVQAAVKRLGIPLAKAGEKCTVIYDGDYQQREQQRAEKLIKAKLPELRLVVNPRLDANSSYLKQVMGSIFVVLATTSKATVEKFLDDNKGKSVSAAVVPGETAAQRKARMAREEKEQDKRRGERIEVNRNRADILWLMETTAQLIAERTTGGGGLVAWAAKTADNLHTSGNYVSEVNALRDAMCKRASVRSPLLIEAYGGGGGNPDLAIDEARRAFIALSVMRQKLCGYKTPGQFFSDPKAVRTGIEKVARDEFNVKLPEGWDQFPVHHTNHNCWNCGRFAGNPKGITKAEMSAGWLVAEKTGTVTCPNCKGVIPALEVSTNGKAAKKAKK